jgi:hypothetical protein
MQAAVLEFRDRPDKPLFCVEHMIEGDYVSCAPAGMLRNALHCWR